MTQASTNMIIVYYTKERGWRLCKEFYVEGDYDARQELTPEELAEVSNFLIENNFNLKICQD